MTVLCILSSFGDALTFEKLKDFKILDDVIEHYEVNEIQDNNPVYGNFFKNFIHTIKYFYLIISIITAEYKKNITKIKSEGNLPEKEEEEAKNKGIFSKNEDNTLGMDALTIIW